MDDPILTSADPEPPPWTIVRDDTGCQWLCQPDREPCGWISEHDSNGADPESWAKVAGNYGPVTVLFMLPADAPELSPQPKPDLAAQIRGAVEEARVTLLTGIHPLEDKRANELADALLGVVDLATKFQTIAVITAPDTAEGRSRIREHAAAQEALVLTVNVIAEKLGIEVDRG